MGPVIFLLILFIGGGWLIGKAIGNMIAPKNDYLSNSKPPNIVNNYYKTEQHVHISKEDLKNLSK